MADTDATVTKKPRAPRKPAAKTASPKSAAGAKTAKATVDTDKLKEKAKATASTARAKAVDAGNTVRAKINEKLDSVDWKSQADELRSQAEQMARNAAGNAKDKTGSAMHSLSKLINDTAETVDSKLGPQYGDYARNAAESVAKAAQSLDDTDLDALFAEAKAFVRKSPAVAIGAAAIAGFVLMRLAKGSDSDT